MICSRPLAEVVNKEISWCWRPYLPFGKVTLLQGSTGMGKTTLLVKLMADLSRGVLPPTMYRGRLQPSVTGNPIRSFYVSVENAMDDTIAPLFDLYHGDRTYVDFQDESQNHFVLSGQEIEDCVAQTGARLIIVDPWQQFLSKQSTSNNDALRAMICDVQAAAERTGVAVLFAGNFTKNGGDDLLKGIGGAELMNTLRCILTLRDDPNGDKSLKLLEPTKMSLLGKEKALVGIRQDDEMQLHFEDYEDVEKDETSIDPVIFLQRILADGPVDSNEVRRRANDEQIGMGVLYRNREKAGVLISRQGDRSSIWSLAE